MRVKATTPAGFDCPVVPAARRARTARPSHSDPCWDWETAAPSPQATRRPSVVISGPEASRWLRRHPFRSSRWNKAGSVHPPSTDTASVPLITSLGVRALEALKSASQATQFADWAADFKNPLAPAALLSLADLGDRQVVGREREGLASRNDGIVIASATAAGKLLATGDPALADLGDLLVDLPADTQADYSTRAAALKALFAAHDPRLDYALVTAETDVKLENTGLLSR